MVTPNGEPHPDNNRVKALEIFNREDVTEEEPMFGIEQEFFFTDSKGIPLGGFVVERREIWATRDMERQGKYYCGVGAGKVFGRQVIEKTLDNALYCGLNVTGLNFEVAPGQCEMQLCDVGIKAADDLILLRYLLVRTAENFNIGIEFHPKPIEGDWNGSGCHTNFFSTKSMREKNGYRKIIDAIEKLKIKHNEHIEIYGKDNKKRLTGEHETASFEKFSYGVADRGSSIRIPRFTERDQCGYLEDRRPASNMDPYLVTSKIVETILF